MIEVILMEPRKQENIGSIARVMKNFCFENLVLVNPRCKIGITAYKVVKHGKKRVIILWINKSPVNRVA